MANRETLDITAITSEFTRSQAAFERILNAGFYTWVKENDLGHLGGFATLNLESNFIVRQEIFVGQVKRTIVSGKYNILSSELNIYVEYSQDNCALSVRCYIDDKPVVGVNPSDHILQLVIPDSSYLYQGEGAHELAFSSGIKMLQDIRMSVPDVAKNQEMFARMSKEKQWKVL